MKPKPEPRPEPDAKPPARKKSSPLAPVPAGIERSIFLIRGQKVMLDAHLARLYGAKTRALVQAVKRNRERFPPDFMFQVNEEEFEALRSHSVISNGGRGGRRYRPYAFTEQGVAMLAGVLQSPRAVAVHVEIMRAFVRLRQVLATHKELAARLHALEKQFVHKSKEHEAHIQRIYRLLDELINPVAPPKRQQIGYLTEKGDR